MSSSCCGNCGCDPCLCENPYQPDVDNLKEGTPVIQITGTPETSCTDPSLLCEMGPECEELIITELALHADASQLYTVTVCDALIYIPGTCVVLHGTATTSSSKQAVLRIESVDGPNRQVSLRQYPNEHDNAGETLSGTLYLCPNALCPKETVVPDCPSTHEFFTLTDSTFTVPPVSPPTSSAAFTLTECTDLQINDRIKIDNAGCFDIDSVADNGTTLTVTNPGFTDNALPGVIFSAGARVTLSVICNPWIEDEETPFPDQLPPDIWVSSKTEYCPGELPAGAHYTDLSYSLLDRTLFTQGTSGVLLKLPAAVDDLYLVQAHVSMLSPSVELDIVEHSERPLIGVGGSATGHNHPETTEYCWISGSPVLLTDGSFGPHDHGGAVANDSSFNHYASHTATISKVLHITGVNSTDPFAYLTIMYSQFMFTTDLNPSEENCRHNWYGSPWNRFMWASKINSASEYDVGAAGHGMGLGLGDCYTDPTP